MTDEKPSLRTLTCPACGAPLEESDEPTIRCIYCNNVIERTTFSTPASSSTPPVISDLNVQPVVTSLPPIKVKKAANTAVGATGCNVALSSLLGIVLPVLIGAIVIFVVWQGQHSQKQTQLNATSTAEARIFLTSPIGVLPAEEQTLPDLIGAEYDSVNEVYFLTRVDLLQHRRIWRSAALPKKGGYIDRLAFNESLAIVATGIRLMALKLDDGAIVWEVALTDRINYREDGLLIAGGKVVVLTIDEVLSAFDAQTGQISWTRRLAAYTPLYVRGDHLITVDRKENDDGVLLLSLEDGSEQKWFTPTCEDFFEEQVRMDTGFAFDGETVFLVMGYSPGCVQRLDFAQGQIVWNTLNEKEPSPAESPIYVQTSDNLYIGQGGLIWAVDKTTGQWKWNRQEEDYQYIPLTMAGNHLIVRAIRTRGTKKYELRGLDPETGEDRWKYDLGDSGPLDPPDEISGLIDDDQTGWTWILTSAGLVILKAQAEPHQLIIETIDPQNGSMLSQKSLNLDWITGSFYSPPKILGRSESNLWVYISPSVLLIDLESKEIIGSIWP